jgi:endonuclease YncB( thermonuclease family)
MSVRMNRRVALGLAAYLVLLAPHAAIAWTEPPATLAPVPFARAAPRAVDGDTLACADGTRVRLRGVDTPERGEPGWIAAREELQRRVAAGRVVVIPHHHGRGRIVGDVLVGGRNVGQGMDAAGWSKPEGRAGRWLRNMVPVSSADGIGALVSRACATYPLPRTAIRARPVLYLIEITLYFRRLSG